MAKSARSIVLSPMYIREILKGLRTTLTMDYLIKTGSVLFVKERWALPKELDKVSASLIRRGSPHWVVWYEADGAKRRLTNGSGGIGRLRAGYHMPEWASRLTLLITGSVSMGCHFVVNFNPTINPTYGTYRGIDHFRAKEKP